MAFMDVMLLGPCVHLASQFHLAGDVILSRWVHDVVEGRKELFVLLLALARRGEVRLVWVVGVIVVMVWLWLRPFTLTAVWAVLRRRVFALDWDLGKLIVALALAICAAVSDAVSACQSLFVLPFLFDSFLRLLDSISLFAFFLVEEGLLFDFHLVYALMEFEVWNELLKSNVLAVSHGFSNGIWYRSWVFLIGILLDMTPFVSFHFIEQVIQNAFQNFIFDDVGNLIDQIFDYFKLLFIEFSPNLVLVCQTFTLFTHRYTFWHLISVSSRSLSSCSNKFFTGHICLMLQ